MEAGAAKKGILVINDKEHPVEPPEIFQHLKHEVNPLAKERKDEHDIDNV